MFKLESASSHLSSQFPSGEILVELLFLGFTFDFIIHSKNKLSTKDTHLYYVHSERNINYKYQRDGDRKRERD